MSTQLFEDGKVVNIDGAELECVSVGYQEVDGKKRNFTYGFRLKSEVDAEREALAQAEDPDAVPEENQPEPIEEETLNVR